MLQRLKAEWLAIAGPELAVIAWPEALGRDGTLKLRVSPSAALELQHRAPLLLERVNLYLGRNSVARLVLRQGTLPVATSTRLNPPRELSRHEQQNLEARLGEIADPGLREALHGLGRLLLTKASGRD